MWLKWSYLAYKFGQNFFENGREIEFGNGVRHFTLRTRHPATLLTKNMFSTLISQIA